KTFGYTKDERSLIFGLSNAQAAATLAAVLVGYNVILGQTPDGEPIRLLDDSVLNGTIVMIFITCTIASVSAQRGAHRISMSTNMNVKNKDKEDTERILIPLRNPQHTEELILFANAINNKSNVNPIAVTNIIDNQEDDTEQLVNSQKIFEKAAQIASAADKQVNTLLRYDTSFINGILNLIREHSITDLVLGINSEQYMNQSSLGLIINRVIKESNINTYIYRAQQPLQTVKRYVLILPPRAEEELGFPFWVKRVWNMARNTGSNILVFSSDPTRQVIENINKEIPIEISFRKLPAYRDILIISKEIKSDDALIFVLSKKHNTSYDENMEYVPSYIDSYFRDKSFILIFPMQQNAKLGEISEMINPSASTALSRIEDLTGNIAKIVKRKE
ncbi:MAG: cation:proton antiporter, partial [Bacteroidales bacterium]